jgi:2-polyprenyl-3-methyl-5-hydroxy-6-metoxy-1,4-benzoquinol methylase
MNRNYEFYQKYTIADYYKDYISSNLKYFTLYVNNYETQLIINLIDESTRNILIIGMGFGRELDIIGKISKNCTIDVIDFSKDFIDFGTTWYKSINFHLRDLNKDTLSLNKSYDLIISLNTLEYLNNDSFFKIMSEIQALQNPNGKFIFRVLSDEFFQKKRVLRDLNNRSKYMPIYYLRNIDEVLKSLVFNNVKLIKSPIKLDGFIFEKIYIYFWPTFVYFERLVRFLIPFSKCRAVYFICSKK